MKNLIITVVMFFFLAGVAIAGAININTADQKTLETLPGVGATKAEAIISYRKAHTFKSVEELAKVKGIGDKTVKKLKKQITVKGE
ncbi:MAG: DNA-binding protein [Desulfocapsa sp.]|nr:MAG: DNA-binding protein [Desulfocapsa sp.]